MSKPTEALQLPADADLSAVSMVEAMAVADKAMGWPEQYAILHGHRYELRIASQNLDNAVTLAYLLGATIVLDSGYDRDEWSVTASAYKNDAGPVSATVWSPGA